MVNNIIGKTPVRPKPVPSPANAAKALGRRNLLTQFLQPESFSHWRAVEYQNATIIEAAAPLYWLHLTS